jgi:hypothetical protein
MNPDESPRRHPHRSDGTACVIASNTHWHDAELAMRVARHSFERWRTAGQEDPAMMHAHHTHTALHEAARAIAMLIETLRAETTALITTPARSTVIHTQRNDHPIAGNAPHNSG